MRIIPPSFEILSMPEGDAALRLVELAGRTCYKSEDRMTPDSAREFARRIVSSKHLSVIEHVSASVKIVCDRGVTHEIVRHRLASFSQESTRYCNYAQGKFGGEITVIRPFFWKDDEEAYAVWRQAMEAAETAYLKLLELGARPQEARSVLPNSLKTEIAVTANLREWRHIFDLRCAGPSHPQMRETMLPILAAFHERLPVFFDDLHDRFAEDIARFTE